MQTASSLTLEDGTVVSGCDRCKETYANSSSGKVPPCDTCRVELLHENIEAAHVFMMGRNQCLTIGDHILDINIPAIKIIMDLYHVPDQMRCLIKVLKVFHFCLSKRRENESRAVESEGSI